MMDAALLVQVGGQIAASLIAYGAVRADLRNMKERIAMLESIVFKPLTKGA
jgi:hypothetical protein